MDYHRVKRFQASVTKANRAARKLREQLKTDPNAIKTLIVNEGSPLKDPARIRAKEVLPNENGVFEVPSRSREGGIRVWASHTGKSIYPVKGKRACRNDFVTLRGPDLLTLVDGHDSSQGGFSEHFQSRVHMSQRQKKTRLLFADENVPPADSNVLTADTTESSVLTTESNVLPDDSNLLTVKS
jgi:hypothetical protein